jgi:hypothetical protein
MQVSWINFLFFSWTLVKVILDLSLATNAFGNEGMPLAAGLMNWSLAPPWVQDYAWPIYFSFVYLSQTYVWGGPASKFKWISYFSFGLWSRQYKTSAWLPMPSVTRACPRQLDSWTEVLYHLRCRVMLEPIFFSFVHVLQTCEWAGPWCK